MLYFDEICENFKVNIWNKKSNIINNFFYYILEEL